MRYKGRRGARFTGGAREKPVALACGGSWGGGIGRRKRSRTRSGGSGLRQARGFWSGARRRRSAVSPWAVTGLGLDWLPHGKGHDLR